MIDNQHIPSGYKPSPLGPIPEDWEVKRLGEVCNFLDSQRVPIKDGDRVKMQGKYPYYGASGIIDYVNDYLFDDDLILLGEDGANILTRSTPLAFLVSGKVWVNNHAHVLKTSTNHNRYYICNYLESLSYDKYNTGTAQPKLNREICENIPILLPNIYEQNKIADILQLWDTAIAKQTALIEQLTLRKRGFMQQLLTGKKRLKGFEGKWKKVKFKDIFLSKKQTNSYGNDIDVLSVTKDGIFSQKEYFNKDIASEDTSKYLLVEKGDLAMSGLNFWMGSCYILTKHERGIISPAYKVFSIQDGFDIDYIVFFVQSHSFKSSLLGSSVIGASIVRRNLDMEMLEEWLYSFPSLNEQKAISTTLNNADKEIELANKKLACLQAQKKGLMQVLLTGKRRINQQHSYAMIEIETLHGKPDSHLNH